jgi:hypothetical protein
MGMMFRNGIAPRPCAMPLGHDKLLPLLAHLNMMNSRSFEYLFRIAHFYDPWTLTQ